MDDGKIKGKDRISDQKYLKNFVHLSSLKLLIHKLLFIGKRLAI